jgi:hypothetical protein
VDDRTELVFTEWAQWLAYQRQHPKWQQIHYPLELSLRWGVTKAAVYAAIARGALEAARVKGPFGETRLFIPDYSALKYEQNSLGTTRPISC